MTTQTTLTAATGLFHLPQSFALRFGGELIDGVLAFELSTDAPSDAPVVLVQGGISSGRHVFGADADDESAPGWWNAIVGPGRAIDTTRHRVLGIDWLGGSGASTGPSTTTQRPLPAVTSHDQAAATALLLDHLRIERLHAFVGASYGAMVGLAFASRFGSRVERLVAISGAHRPDPSSTAWRALQRDVVELGVRVGAPREAASIARGIAMTTYRGRAEFAQRFATAPNAIVDGRARFPVEAYLQARGARFADGVDPASFVTLSQAIDLHDVDPTTIEVATTVVAVDSDRLVPFDQSQELFAGLAGAKRFVTLSSPFGHDAFLTEPEAIGALLRHDLGAGKVTR